MSNELQAALLAWAFAAPFWVAFWAVWSGRLRWLDDDLFGPFAVSFLPGLATSVTLVGVSFATGQPWLFWSSFLPFVVGIVLHFVVAIWDPGWMQPAWYREELASGPDIRGPDTRGRGAELVGGVARSAQEPAGHGPVRFERDAVLLTDDSDRPASVTMRYGQPGRLFVFEDTIVFVQNGTETRLRGEFGPAEIPVDAVQAVRATTPERTPTNLARMLRGDMRGRRFGRLLQIELHEGVVELHLRGLDGAIAAIGTRTPGTP